MAKLNKIVVGLVREAQQNPAQRAEVLRRGSLLLKRLAQDPRNAPTRHALERVSVEFAKAATSVTVDDFTDLLRETAQAYQEVDDDPMELVARRRQIHDDRDPNGLSMSIAPESFHLDATLGRSAIIKWNPTQEEIANGVKQTETLVLWQGTKREAQAITVDVAVIAPPPTPGLDVSRIIVRPYAEVEYGSDGNKSTVRMDLGLGRRFTVVGNYVSVLVGCGDPGTDVPTAPIQVGASIGTFAAPSQAPVFKTEYVDQLAAKTTSGFIPIPLKATQLLMPLTTLPAGSTATLEFFSFNGGLPALYTIDIPTATAWVPIPLVGQFAYMKVYNNAAVACSFMLPFQLSL